MLKFMTDLFMGVKLNAETVKMLEEGEKMILISILKRKFSINLK